MKLKTDENLPLEAATTLREAGFDVETIWDERLSGATDATVSSRIQQKSRVLVTLDLDFANIRAYPPERYAGIVVLRSKTQDKPTVVAYVRKYLTYWPRLARNKGTKHMDRTWLRGLVAALVLSAGLFGQGSVRGHWTGDIEIPGHTMGMVVDLDKTPNGWIGAIGIPAQGSSGLPLTDIRIDGNKCAFRIKGVPGDPTFSGALSADAKTISGEFSQGGGTFPFKMTRAGDPKIEERKASPAVAQELVGTWEGTLEVGGQSLRLSLKLANDSDGAKGTLVSVDQGGAEIEVTTIAQSGSKLDLVVRPIGGEYHGELTPARTALKGTWSQNGNDFPLELTKKVDPASK